MSSKEPFIHQFSLRLQDKGLGSHAVRNIQTAERKFKLAVSYFEQYEVARYRASWYRSRVIENLEKHLTDFEAQLIKNNFKVSWITDFAQLSRELFSISAGKPIFRGAGDIFTESGFEEEIKKNNLEISRLETGTAGGIFLSEVRFGLVETGSLVFDNQDIKEEVARTKSEINIIIVPIDRLIYSLQELELLLSLRSTHYSGKSFPSHLSIHSQPNSETIVFLLDQNRSLLMEDSRIRQSLYCISCGLCTEVCPVSQWIGEDAYKSPYTGPIGSIRNSIQFSGTFYKEQTSASTNCGKCDVICPANIPLSDILSYKQKKENETEASKAERLMYFLWRNGMEKRSKLEKGGSKVRNFMLRQFFRKVWGSDRELPQVSQKSFYQQWMESRGKSV
jgi:L-lactate dehydrogenase complex protein LldF